jgi:hypothetical protein
MIVELGLYGQWNVAKLDFLVDEDYLTIFNVLVSIDAEDL